MQSIKEHNLKANHNSALIVKEPDESVCNLSKNTIWKQITTQYDHQHGKPDLYAIYQRTQSESKSQHNGFASCCRTLCMQSIKEHNLKANHNYCIASLCWSGSVCNLSKNTIWKQITTLKWSEHPLLSLYAIYQRTQSESKSQLQGATELAMIVCMQSIKEHNLKANHNSLYLLTCALTSVCNLSKNTIWKQITTPMCMQTCHQILYAIYQRTQSESKSQLFALIPSIDAVCMQSIKEHNLKANHN